MGSHAHLTYSSILSKASYKDIFHCSILLFRVTVLIKSGTFKVDCAEFVLFIY